MLELAVKAYENRIDPIGETSLLTHDVQNRRRWRNYFNKPGYNLRYTWYFVVGGLAIFAVTALLIHMRLSEVTAITNANPVFDLSAQAHVQAIQSQITEIALAGFSLYLVCSIITAFVMSHRIAGPMVALTDIFNQFKAGNYGYRRPLRRGDELTQIHGQLMELGEALNERLASGSGRTDNAEDEHQARR